MSHHSPLSTWLMASTGAARAELRADMIVDGEIEPVNAAKPWLVPIPSTGQIFMNGFAEYLKALAQPLRARDSLPGSQRALFDIVEQEIVESPFEAEGRKWANLSGRTLSEKLGLSADHVRRLYRGNPFRHVTKMVNGKKTTLIRIGHPSDLTPEDQARMMVKFWRQTTGRKETEKEFGCLVGIAKDCPTGLSYDIFRTVVRNWSTFMAGAKIAQYIGHHAGGDAFDQNPDNFYPRFFVFPTIKVIRRFVWTAAETYEMAVQEATGGPKCQNVCSQILKVLKDSELQSSFISVGTKKQT